MHQKLFCFLPNWSRTLFSTVWILNFCVIGNHLYGFSDWLKTLKCRWMPHKKENKKKNIASSCLENRKVQQCTITSKEHSLFPFLFHRFAIHISFFSFNVFARESYFQINQEKSSNISHIKHYEFTYLLIRLK